MAIYRVGITPRGFEEEVDLTDRVKEIGKISQTIDAADFLVGVTSLDAVRITLLSPDEVVSTDGIFTNGFARSRVSIYLDENLLFVGTISDEGSKFTDNTASFLCLTPAAELKNTTLESFNLSEGQQCSAIIGSILRSRPFRGVFGNLDIRPDIDFIVDAPGSLLGQSTLDALNELLVLSNSFLSIDTERNVKVSSRLDATEVSAVLYGPYDEGKRTPSILKLADYNSGAHRTINRVTIGEDESKVVMEDNAFINEFGLKEKNLESEVVTVFREKQRIALNILESFKTPKVEFKVVVPTEEILAINLGDVINVDYRKRLRAHEGIRPRFGIDRYGHGIYCGDSGIIRIDPTVNFILYEKHDNPTNFTSELKLRAK